MALASKAGGKQDVQFWDDLRWRVGGWKEDVQELPSTCGQKLLRYRRSERGGPLDFFFVIYLCLFLFSTVVGRSGHAELGPNLEMSSLIYQNRQPEDLLTIALSGCPVSSQLQYRGCKYEPHA